MNIKQKVDESLELMGKKHFTRYLKKNSEFVSFVFKNTPSTLSFIERLTLLYHSTNHICEHGNKKKFISLERGFGFCGKTGVCECAKREIGKKVSIAKSNYSLEKKDNINKKRIETNLKLYGVSNVGQTTKARIKHKQFYENEDNIVQSQEKYKTTMMTKYGVNNGFNTEAANHHRLNNNPFSDPKVRQKSIDIRKLKAKEGIYLKNSYDKLQNFILSEFNVKFMTPKELYKGVSNNQYYDFKCLRCNHEFATWLDNGHDPICKICNPNIISYVSKEEKELADWVESLGFMVDRHNKTFINPYECDIIIHSRKLVIEYCGLYWHSEYRSGKSSDYHKKKMKLVNNKGYRLITIFSDEWNLQREKVKNILRHVLGVSNSKIDARKCNIVKINIDKEKEFLNKYHLQGWVSSEICYGLEYNSDIVGLMSFGSNRVSLNRKNILGEWEIRRLSFSKNVRGGSNKLLRYFEKSNNPAKLWSDVDLRWSEGAIYLTMGMIEFSESDANYSYVKNYTERIHRLNLTKKRLIKMGFDSNKTEREITQELGYDVIWDCGIKRFVKEY